MDSRVLVAYSSLHARVLLGPGNHGKINDHARSVINYKCSSGLFLSSRAFVFLSDICKNGEFFHGREAPETRVTQRETL